MKKLIKLTLFVFFFINPIHAKTEFLEEGIDLFNNKKFREAKFKFEKDIVFNPKNEISYLSNLGEEIGLLFQLADDFLDIKSSKKLAGKNIGKDSKKGKSTLLNIMGYEKTYTYANNLKKKILLKLRKHGKNAEDLIKTIEFILGRNF